MAYTFSKPLDITSIKFVKNYLYVNLFLSRVISVFRLIYSSQQALSILPITQKSVA